MVGGHVGRRVETTDMQFELVLVRGLVEYYFIMLRVCYD